VVDEYDAKGNITRMRDTGYNKKPAGSGQGATLMLKPLSSMTRKIE
jgi:hypothetical protein